jgi:DNA-3-methyladenine glycosylase I
MAGEGSGLGRGDDGRRRCWWATSSADYSAYHDDEWGRPVLADDALFERLTLEAFQSGLSWLTILRKRENFRSAFADFHIPVVAGYGSREFTRLMNDAGIVRNRLKIEAAIANAQCAIDVVDEHGSLAAFVWQFRPARHPAPRRPSDLAAQTAESKALARELKRRGFKFVGPTTAYAAMQAAGVVNDHLVGCHVRRAAGAEQTAALKTLKASG